MIPTTCAGDVSSFSSTVPNVSLFAPDYIPQRSWRANLNWNVPILDNRFRLTSGATYSLNLNQQSQVDLNFNQKPRFTLPSEGPTGVRRIRRASSRRPARSSRDARVTQEFAQVTDYLSDLRSHSDAVERRHLAGRVQLGVPVERHVRLAEGRRRDARLRRRQHGRRSVPDRSGRAAIATRATRSRTTSATRSIRR